ncbi:MAG: hypothetical protein ISS81_00995 [Candidatus Marinimicrobia bacterium]|nr:hypothetical protein [Candidatus Neomarinimicrobiota bacterium]
MSEQTRFNPPAGGQTGFVVLYYCIYINVSSELMEQQETQIGVFELRKTGAFVPNSRDLSEGNENRGVPL